MKDNVTKTTCQGLLLLGFFRIKAFVNFSMSLACNIASKSIVGLSLNKFFHYHYSNMCKVTHLLADNEENWRKNNKTLLDYFYPVSNCVPQLRQASTLDTKYRLVRSVLSQG